MEVGMRERVLPPFPLALRLMLAAAAAASTPFRPRIYHVKDSCDPFRKASKYQGENSRCSRVRRVDVFSNNATLML